jgi:hypothetical protein
MALAAAPAPKATSSRRSYWIRQNILWHWVSSGICLGGMLLFTVTGITLNHASSISATPVVTQTLTPVPLALQAQYAGIKAEGKQPVPTELASWLANEFRVSPPESPAEWSEAEVYISLPRPGGDGWVSIDRVTGIAKYERTDRGWIAYVNDLHKGRHTGPVWAYFIDVIAVAFLIFTFTGFILLQTHAPKRPSTWPLVAFGLIVPIALMLLFVHK